MICKKLREIYPVDTISQEKGWKKVHDAISDITEDIEIDFSGVNVIDPWQCIEFKQLLRDKKVHMKFVNNDKIVKQIRMMCIIEGLDDSRISNTVVEVQKEKTPEEKKIENFGKELITYFDIDEEKNEAILELEKRYSQLQSTNTLDYVDYAIRSIHDNNKIDKFILKLNKIVILPNVIEVIANMMVKYEKDGFHLFVDSDDPETLNNVALFIHKATAKKYSYNERARIIMGNLKKDTPGLLVKYKKSKAKDDFGREGKGEVISSRIAIYRGIKQGDKQSVFVVEAYNNEYFYTKQHWMVEHDNEEPSSLDVEVAEIPLDEIGVGDHFLGSRYHFILPIQHDESENQTVIKDLDENGRNIKQLCSIPERMKIVFDSWGVKYNKEELDKSIIKTKEYLEKKRNGEISTIEGIYTA